MSNVDEAELAAEAQAARWWSELQLRSTGTMHIPEWAYLHIGVLLRRFSVIKRPKSQSLNHYRTLNGWATLIERQVAQSDPDLPDYQAHILDFFLVVDGPWGVTYDQREGKWAIHHYATLDEDIEYARNQQSKRMEEERRWRDLADRSCNKQGGGAVIA